MKKLGFTLLELSIVLVIIGLLAGSVMIGQSVRQSAALRETMGDYDRYIKATKEFMDKYQGLPGDFTGATALWGTSPNGCPDTSQPAVKKIPTCNGDGNGQIGSQDGAGTWTNTHEWWLYWQHLANAGFIQGQYTGVAGATGYDHADIGVNVPQTKMKYKVGWTMIHWNAVPTNSNIWQNTLGHMLMLGESNGSFSNMPGMSTSEAQMIDDKMDDGKPGYGFIRPLRTAFASNTCTNNDTTQSAQTYNLSNVAEEACMLLFTTGF